VGLLLAKFLNNAPMTGVRRALGASRKQVFFQHLVEVGVISSIGAVLGLALGGLLLMGLKALYTVDVTDAGGTQALAHVDLTASLRHCARILRDHRRRSVPGFGARAAFPGHLPEGAMT
jgi:putative ABC transport system permease protein